MKGASESLRFSGAGLYLGAAVVLALLAGFAVYSYLHAAVPSGAVYTVTRDLPPGTKITAGDITTKEVPAVARPEGAIEKREEIVGQRTRFGMAAGDIIRKTHLAPVANSEIPQKVAAMGESYRAVMISAELVPGKGRLVAGDRLELLAVMQVMEGTKSTQRIMPLGMATVLDSPDVAGGEATTLLIALKADEVARFALAQRTGTIVVAVPGEGTTQFVPALKLEELTGSAPAPIQPAATAQMQPKPPGQ